MRIRAAGWIALGLASMAAVATSGPPTQPAAVAANLERLIRAQGVSGFEADVRAAIQALLPAWATPHTDEIGNLTVTIGQGRPHVLLAGAIDEDGYIVSRIMEDGYLRVQRVTTGVTNRLFDQYHYGQPVLVRTVKGTLVPGVFGSASQHLQRGVEPSTAIKGLDDLWLDVGAETSGAASALGIQLLDPVALRARAEVLAGGRVAGVAAQARAGALALVDLLRRCDQPPAVKGSLTIAWTVQGSFGGRGFARLAQAIDADRVIIVGRSAVQKDSDAKGAHGRLGGGPLVSDRSSTLLDLAKQEGVAVQPVPAASLRLPSAWPNVQVEAVAIPVLFMHTPVETVDTSDIGLLTALLAAATGLPPGAEPAAPAASPKPIATEPQAPRTGPDAEPAVLKTLRTLVETYGVSGHETPVRETVQKMLPAWAKPAIDARGNLTVSFGQGGTEIAFVAHLDELGYEIASISDEGLASLRNRGGMSDAGHEAHPVLVHTARGVVPAIVAPRPNYLRATESRPRAEEMALYFGTESRSATEALGVARGDSVTVRKALVRLGRFRATARSLDDRNGVAALLAALSRLDPAKVPNRVTFAWAVGEEIGLVGSAFLAERLHPAYVFAVDTFVSSDTPLDPQRLAHIPLGSGAVLRAIDNSSIAPPELVARVVAIARAHRIPIAVGTTNGGNDGSSFTRYGTLAAGLSWPGRYSHSPVEVMDVRDLDALIQLIVAIASEPRF